ncbi:MAG: hypothetical protein ACREP6_07145 [Candidatus Binataceae bacterium]
MSTGLVLSCVLALAVGSYAAPVTTTSGQQPRHAGLLWGKVKTEGNESAQNVSVVVRTIKNDRIGRPVAIGTTNSHGAYSINVGSLPQGKYVVAIDPGASLSGGYLGGQTITVLRGPQASKHLDWTLYGTQSAVPFARWTKVPAGSSASH